MVVNVLSKDHYDECHIEGSINAPFDELEKHAQSWDKQKEIVVYCASYICSASKNAYHKLKKMGFTHVHAYEGGTKEWKEKGFPVNGSCA